MKKIAIINGVNLGKDVLGTREPRLYGTRSFDDYFAHLQQLFPELELHYFQNDVESQVVTLLHECKDYDGIVLNPGAFTHTSLVVADAVKAIAAPVIEVHISNLFGREKFRRESMIAAACRGSIIGLGFEGYALSLSYFNFKP